VVVFVMALQPLILAAHLTAQAGQSVSAAQMINQMLLAEETAWRSRQRFLYKNEERSSRTNGGLWDELVVETPDGPMQRLISEDGKPLSDNQKNAEDRRITYLAHHPDEFRRKTRRRKDDEARMPELLKEIPNAFLFNSLSSEGGFTRIAFQPNPSFHEETYQDRVVHAMAGVLIIHTPDMRLWELDADLEHKVEFGFGILGVLRETNLSLARREVSSGQWTTTKIHVHLDGNVLLLKSISQDVDASRYEFKIVAHDLSAAEAAAVLRSNAF